MINLCAVVGARPQFIKAAMFLRAVGEAAARGQAISGHLVHTGQHYDDGMNAVFFNELGLPQPVANLGVAGGSHGDMTGRMLIAIEDELRRRAPDMVVVFGDTNSTLAAALAAAKLGIPVAHVEAGLRHYCNDIPEEINRRLADHLSALLFCPSKSARGSLEREGITNGVHVVGDITYDMFKLFSGNARWPEGVERPRRYVVATIHRAANTDDGSRLGEILAALGDCPHPVILPVHPRTRKAVAGHGLRAPANIRLVDPVSYLEMIALVRDSKFVVTDSGGLQKEAFFCGKRCITLSSVSPWVELAEIDANLLVGGGHTEIVSAFPWATAPASKATNPYGDGRSAEHSVGIVLDWFAVRDEPEAATQKRI